MLQDKLHLVGRDAPLLVLAEHPERVLEVGLGVHVHDLLLDHKAEVLEVEGGGAVVNLVHHVLHLMERWLRDYQVQ